MKSYTNLEQSKKLAEILPLKSADMRFCFSHTLDGRVTGHYPMIGREPSMGTIPCWSLAAMLSVLDFPSLTQNKEDEWEVCIPNHKSDEYIETSAYNPVDACYKMIIRLNELNLL